MEHSSDKVPASHLTLNTSRKKTHSQTENMEISTQLDFEKIKSCSHISRI